MPAPQGCQNFFSSAILIIDIDGPNKGYSKMGQDVFYFSYISSKHYCSVSKRWDCNSIPHITTLIPGGLCFYGDPYVYSGYCYGAGGCSLNATTSNGRPAGTDCSVKIIKNGFQYPDDYPWALVNKRPDDFVKYK